MQVISEGTPVTFIFKEPAGKIEHGIVKNICDDPRFAYVVYNCGNDWTNYQNYTPEKTVVSSLKVGWL